MTCQIDNTSPGGGGGGAPGGGTSPWLSQLEYAHLDKQSSNISAEEIRESGKSFQSLTVCGSKLLLYASLLADGI